MGGLGLAVAVGCLSAKGLVYTIVVKSFHMSRYVVAGDR